MSIEQRKNLEQQLWNVADTLRGKMNADEYRIYMLGFIFYKYLSEKMEIYADSLLTQDKVKFRDLNEQTPKDKELIDAVKEDALDQQMGFFLLPKELFSEVIKDSQNIIQNLQKTFDNFESNTLGAESEESFKHLFEDVDLNSTKLGRDVEDRNKVIKNVLEHLDKIDFKHADAEIDVLGDAYEYLIGQFASNAGKKAGEFYTPAQVSKLLAKIVCMGKTKLKSVYDPTCGSGSLLLRVAKEMTSTQTEEQKKAGARPKVNVEDFFGQELNRTTFNLARMNMILHEVSYRNFDLKQEDTLLKPQHLGKTFEAVVANPPFSANWSANAATFDNDERFSPYGRLAPATKADFAFVQHMIHHLADNGVMAVVLPHGALFRGGAELHIRKYLIENVNYLDAVIGLPANIFYGTSIPTCVLVFKKCKESPNDIFFIDASNEFEKVKTQNMLLDEHLNKIIDTLAQRKDINKYSRKVSLQEVSNNDYNLNIPRYIDTFEAQQNIDIDAIAKEIQNINNNMAQIDLNITAFCKELNISTPF